MTLFKEKEIILINPPNKKIVLRDFYSSTISKGKYNWPNIDLLSLSATLNTKFSTNIIDANTNQYSLDQTINFFSDKENLAGVIVAVGKSVLKEDYKFIKLLKKSFIKKNQDIKIAVVGGIIYHNAENEIKENFFIDACILNFTTNDALKYFNDEYENLNNIVYRYNNKIIKTSLKLPEWGFKLPIPRHDQLPLAKYQLSHGKNTPLTSVLTSYGCPHKCSFCVSGRIQYRYRDPENIIEELKYLKNIGVKEITFRDNIFGFHKKTALELLKKIIKNNLKFSWVSDSRVDILDEELIELMSKAGCHALHFGIETVNEFTLNEYDKNLKKTDFVSETIRLCKKYNILVVGYFILGLPGESIKDANNTIEYAVRLGCDYASFNLPMPIVGTELREKSISEGWLVNKEESYDGSAEPIISTDLIKSNELVLLQKKAYRKFYFRLSFVFEKIFKIRTLFQFKMLLFEGYHLLIDRR